MQQWPVTVHLGTDADLSFGLFGKSLYLRRLKASTLSCTLDVPAAERLVAVSESADTLRFVPSLGDRPLLLFPRPRLLCPGSLKLTVIVELPLHVTMAAGVKEHFDMIETYTPPTVSKGLYGPVDAGIVCASIKARCAPTLADLGGDEAPDEQGDLVLPDQTGYGLHAYARLEVTNATDSPLEVTKIMIPAHQLILYQTEKRLLTNTIHMKLVSKQEAELSMGGPPLPGATPIATGQQAPTLDRRSLIFSHAYRSKTGLDYGF